MIFGHRKSNLPPVFGKGQAHFAVFGQKTRDRYQPLLLHLDSSGRWDAKFRGSGSPVPAVPGGQSSGREKDRPTLLNFYYRTVIRYCLEYFKFPERPLTIFLHRHIRRFGGCHRPAATLSNPERPIGLAWLRALPLEGSSLRPVDQLAPRATGGLSLPDRQQCPLLHLPLDPNQKLRHPPPRRMMPTGRSARGLRPPPCESFVVSGRFR